MVVDSATDGVRVEKNVEANVVTGLAPILAIVSAGKLYPSLILHGGSASERGQAAVHLGRALLCNAGGADRPCEECSDCERIGLDDEHFHPDFHVLARDRPTVTSTDAVRNWVREAHLAPFEARAKVFVLLEAETLGADAADVLLKVLEEPPGKAARYFILLTPNDSDLPSTVRSRSMPFYLGASDETSGVAELSDELERIFSGKGGDSIALAAALVAVDDGKDARSGQPWQRMSAALMQVADRTNRPWLLEVAADLLQGPTLRIRGIPTFRIVEGMLANHAPEGR